MINVHIGDSVPTVESTVGVLTTYNEILPQFLDLDKILQYVSYIELKLKECGGELKEYTGELYGGQALGPMKNYLVCHNYGQYLKTTDAGGISLSKDVIAEILARNDIPDELRKALTVYQKYSSLIHMRSTLLGKLQFPVSAAPSCDGHRMLMVRPQWVAQNTGRIGMQDPAIQNMERELQDIITVPKGYKLIHTDSGQIEPRIVYSYYIPDPQIKALINLYNDAYFGLLHYCTMDKSFIDSGTLQFKPMEITDEMKAGRKKIKTYGNAVMYGSTSNITNDPIKAAMIQRIGNHPMRQRLVADIESKLNSGIRKFPTAFGTPIDISLSKKLSYGSNDLYQYLKLAINNPIQGTAADMMRISVSAANKLLLQRGQKSAIIGYIHDAGLFAVHEDEYDALASELSDIVSYQVDDWITVHAEPEVGRNNGKGGLIEDLY